jgi:hypothetical protein
MEQVTRKQVIYLVLEIAIGLTIAYFLGNFVKSQPFMNTTLRAGQFRYGQDDASLLLWGYLGCLFLLTVGGFLLAKKYEENDDMSLLDGMIGKALELSEKLKKKWKDQITYTINESRKKGKPISKEELLTKFVADKSRMQAMEMMGMTVDDVENMIDEVLKENP